jgi:hypothetical protein
MRILLPLLITATPLAADPAEVVDVTATATEQGWRFEVTLAHGDTGWDDYADGWRVELGDGTVLGTRALAHPHVAEQPFTRATGGIVIPEATTEVHIRSSTNTEGWSATTTAYPLPRAP